MLAVIDDKTNYDISNNKMVDLINNSSKLNEEEKNYLINENLFDDVVESINVSNNGLLVSYRIDDMDIKNMGPIYALKNPKSDGYYNSSDTTLNIYIC